MVFNYNALGKTFSKKNAICRRGEQNALITIKDLAKIAGVSVSTVSRALSNSRKVTPDIKANIEKIAKQYGYTPNTAARSLVKKDTNAIGIVVTNLHDPFFHDLLMGFEAGAAECDYHIVFCSTMGHKENDIGYLKYLSNGIVDGLILYGIYRFDEAFIREIHTTGFPLLLIENKIEGLNVNVFTVDNKNGVYHSVQYLYRRGHRRIAYIAGIQNKQVCIDRLEGFRMAATELGLADYPEYTMILENSTDDAIEFTDRLLDMDAAERPTAVLCYDDATAAKVIMRAMERNVRIPQDLSVMGFDSQIIPPMGYKGPAITSVSQPLYDIAFDSVVQMSRYLSGQTKDIIERKYETRIDEKETVADFPAC